MMPAQGDDPNMSLEHIMASELYPKRPLSADDETQQVPFPVLPGESVEYLGKTDGGIIALSNFRLFIRFKEAFINIPLGVIESVEYRDIFYINIYCKDAHSLRCTFATNERCLEWYKRLTAALQAPKKLQDVFAFAFLAWCKDQDGSRQGAALEHGLAYQLCRTEDAGGGYSFGREVDRMGFDLKTAWRICYINEDYKVCPSYPKELVVPACMTDRDLKMVSNFRAAHRLPCVVWRDRRNGAVIARSSQPEVGWLGWRNVEDERLLQAISAACALNSEEGAQRTPSGQTGDVASTTATVPKKLLIIDARSYTAAWANRAKGGGCECIEYYPNCEIQFMSLSNIHTVRKSFYAVRALCVLGPDQPNWLTSVENTKWLSYIGLLLRSAVLIVNAIDKEGRPVLVHCSDGWDRTPQLVALSQLMLDPYYRTVEGLRVLVEREWLALGHKFADRCGNAMTCEDVNERCPVFLQWLDCVHQLQIQFPTAFQFNEAFLVKLAHHTYSGLFGSFLCNTVRERQDGKVHQQTCSVWSLLHPYNRRFINLLYRTDSDQVLRPSYHMRNLRLWKAVYLSETVPAAAEELCDIEDDESTEVLSSPDQPTMSKTRSCDDLPSALDQSDEPTGCFTRARRLSDPQVATDSNSLLQSTESLSLCVTSVDRADKCPLSDNSVHISNGVSSETLTEVAGILTEQVPVAAEVLEPASSDPETTEQGESSTVTRTMNGAGNPQPTPGTSSKDVGSRSDNQGVTNGGDCSDEVGQDTSQYGIARIDSPDRETAQHLGDSNGLEINPGTTSRENGLSCHINGSTDTLTGETADQHQPCNWHAAESSSSISSQTINCVNGKEPICQNGGHNIVTHKPVNDEPVTNRILKNNHHHGDPRHSNGKQYRDNNLVTPFRLEDVLSKLNIESLLEGGRIAEGLELTSMLPALSRGSSSGREDGGDSCSSYQSRTPNCSTGPPTPGTELKGSLWNHRHQSTLARHLDCDGLTSHVDPVQSRLSQIQQDYQNQISHLSHQLQVAKAIIYQYSSAGGASKHLDSADDLLSTESADSGEHGSMGAGSNAASDVSWEQVEERDAHMTLWVPDHAVTHCAGCDQEFWIVRRKHHCRNCGQVFCYECTKHAAPLPEQQLTKPQRVCVKCFQNVSTCGTPTASADGLFVETLTKADGAVASC